MIPLDEVVRLWPPLRTRTGFRLDLDDSFDSHWLPRARGMDPYEPAAAPETGYFTGRTRALSELAEWLNAPPASDRRIRVVTGSPGSGKSAVLARTALLADPLTRQLVHAQQPERAVPLPRPGCIDVAVHARGRTLEEVVQQVAAAAGVEAQDPVELLQQLHRRGTPFTVLLDALDEAAGDHSTRIVSLLGRIAADPARHGFRVLVGTRQGARGASAGALFARLANRLVIDLDSTVRDSRTGLGYLELADVEAFVARRLGETGRNGLARSISVHANGNFLIAQLASAAALAAADGGDASWEALLPTNLGEAVDGYLNIRFGDRAETVRDLLTAVAFAEHPGFGEGQLWLSVAEALTSARHAPADLARMIASAGSYLVEQTTVEPPAYRLFHQALDDTFRVQYGERFPSRNGHRLVYRALLEQVPAYPDGTLRWERAEEYLRVNMAVHAVAAGCLDDLVQDVRYLVTAPPERLLPHLGHVTSGAARAAAFVYRRASHQFADGDHSGRAAVLALVARQTGFPDLAEQAEAHFSPTWSGWPVRWDPEGAEQTVAQLSETYSTALWFDPEGNPAAWFSGELWRTHGYLLQRDDGIPEDGPRHDIFHAHAIHVHDDGSETALSLTGEGVLQHWSLTAGVQLLGELTLEGMGFTMLGAAGLAVDADGRLLGVAAANGVIHLVDMSGDNPRLLDRVAAEDLEPLRTNSVTIANPNGVVHVAWFETVTVEGESTVRVQLARVAADRLVSCGTPLAGHAFNPEVVRFLTRPDGTLLLFAASGDTVTLSEVTPDGLSALPVPLLDQPVTAATGIVLADGRSIAAFGDSGGMLSTWEVGEALTPIGMPRVGHESGVKNLALGVDPTGDLVLLSHAGAGLLAASSGAEVRLWKVGFLPPEPMLPPDPIGAPLYPLAMLSVGDEQVVALTESSDRPFTVLLVTEDSLFALASEAPHPVLLGYGRLLAVAYAATPGVLVVGRLDSRMLQVWRAGENGLSQFTWVTLNTTGLSRDTSHQVNGPLAITETTDGNVLIAAGDANGLVCLWSLNPQGRRRGLGIPRRRSRHDAEEIATLARGTRSEAVPPQPTELVPPSATPFAIHQLTFYANEKGHVRLLGLSGHTLVLWGLSGSGELPVLDTVSNVEAFATMPPFGLGGGAAELVLTYAETDFVGELRVYESLGERLAPVSEPWPAQLEFRSELAVVARPDGHILGAAGDRNGLVRIWRQHRGGTADLVLSTYLGSAVDGLRWTLSGTLVAICRSGILRLTGDW
ncbi:ATP-binding protein [Streptomyces pseudovenezuelae]|nr:ATP-binding protein [Streptomyces pseudovenezuelae]